MPNIVVETKSKLFSKTLWFNGITAVIGAAAYLSGVLPGDGAYYLSGVVIIGNVILRLITKQPLE